MAQSPLFEALEQTTRFLGAKLDKVIKAVEGLDFTSENKKQTTALTTAVSRIEKAIDKIQDPKFTGEVTVDTEPFSKQMEGICTEIKAIGDDLKKNYPSLSPIADKIQAVSDALSRIPSAEVLALLGKIHAALKKLDKPQTFKLDENQIRQLRGAFSGGGGSGGGALLAGGVKLVNVSLAAANTEYSYTFPQNTLAWVIKLRDQGTLGYYAFKTGKMPSGGDSSEYATIPQNFLQSKDGVDWNGKTIYLGAESNSQVAEITIYTL